jgi:alpha-tubulin suppressor-like RCC1 family protein
VPTAVAGTEVFVKLSTPSGSLHNCALTASGQAYCWGPNGNNQLGDGTTTQRTSPTAVDTTLRFTQISTGNLQTCGISHGNLYCWGNNANGQLGVGDTTARQSPTLVAFP